MSAIDVKGYLRRLEIPEPGPPSAAGLRSLHVAHVERVAYEALDIPLGRPRTLDPLESADRIVKGHRGGYCFHLNGAFSALLEALGYNVIWHPAGVQKHSDPEPVGAEVANHLTLTVDGLPTASCPSGDWLVDVGLGDALHAPLPLCPGHYRQGPFTFGLRRSQTDPDGWRLDHDRVGSFAGVDLSLRAATTGTFAAHHEFLSSSPQSPFMNTCSVERHHADGVDSLIGCVLRRVGNQPSAPRILERQDEWFEALRNVFDLPLYDVDPTARAALWSRAHASHQAWRARQVA